MVCLVRGGGVSGLGGGVSGLGGGVPGLGGGVSGPGVCPWGGGIPACTEADTPPPRGQTDACKNITLAQLRCGR